MVNNNLIRCAIVSLCLIVVSCETTNEENGTNQGGNTAELKVVCNTLDVTDIEYSSVKLNGSSSISNAKGEKVKTLFYYSSTASDASNLRMSNKVNGSEIPGNGGSFSALLSGLEASTQYYYMAVVSIDGKEFPGGVKSFTTKPTPKEIAITGEAIAITEKSVTISGSVNPNSDMQDVLMGVLYSLDSSPNIENSTKVQAKDIVDNTFSITLDNLPSSTRYYYKTYIQYNGAQYRFGDIKDFSTDDVNANVRTLDASGITEFKATLNGKLEVSSKASLSKDVWFLFGNSTTTLEDLKIRGNKLPCSLSDDNTFTVSLSDLEYGVTYNYVAVAKVYDSIFYGDLNSFSTNPITATIKDDYASGITEFGAILNAKLDFESAEDIHKQVWFFISDTETTIDGLIANGEIMNSTLNVDGSFTYNLNGLKYGQNYCFIAVAKIHDKLFYSDQVRSFTTKDITIDIRTGPATAITYSEATLNGTIISISNKSFLKSLYFLVSNKETSLEGLISNGIKQSVSAQSDDSFSCNLESLSNGKQYYYVAVAELYDKTYYGDVSSFTTLAYSLKVSTISADNIGISSGTLHGAIITDMDILPSSPFFYYSETSNSIEGIVDSGNRIEVTINDDKTFSCLLSNLNPDTEYFYVAGYQLDGINYYGEVVPFTTGKQVFEAVDLGLSVKWASCNIGASVPEEHGCYYSWGEVRTKSSYTIKNYKWFKESSYNSSGTEITKYCTSIWSPNPDYKHFLDSEDDVAYFVSRGSWRMPTDYEIRELFNNCSWEYVTRKGVSGYNVTSKINGNSIFLSESGVFNSSTCYQGHSACYFSTYTSGDGSAFALYFYETERLELSSSYRYLGHTVRPVCD